MEKYNDVFESFWFEFEHINSYFSIRNNIFQILAAAVVQSSFYFFVSFVSSSLEMEWWQSSCAVSAQVLH